MSAPMGAHRPRNAAATRAAILLSARGRFAREGYDGASLREIAADAGVDAALVARYFGSKEELFREALTSEETHDLFRADRAEFGEHVARMLLSGGRDNAKLEKLLMVLRSVSAPQAADAIRTNTQETFYLPIEKLLGGRSPQARARVVAAVITGFAINRAIDENFLLDGPTRNEICRQLARLLQQIVDDQPCDAAKL